MPSPGKASIVPHVREVLRFSSLPHSLEPLPRGMDIDHIANLSEGPNLDQSPVASRTPPQRESDSSCKISLTEVKDSRSDDYQPPVVASGLEVIVSNVSPVRPSSSDVGGFSTLARYDIHIRAAIYDDTADITRGTRQ
jgi:hypothetical protein